MPIRPQHKCRYPGCIALTRVTYCEKHYHIKQEQIKAAQERYGKERGTSTQRGYGSRHATNRDRLLKEKPLCERCKANGIVRVSMVYHHKDHNQFNTSDENKEALCFECHEIEHGRRKK